MTLATEWIARIATQRQVELTRPNDLAATTVDTTLLGLATDDVEAELEIEAGVAYDNTDNRHIAIAVPGVTLKLLQYKSDSAYEEKNQAWLTRVSEKFRLVSGNNRVRPKSSSKLTPQDENPTNTPKTPRFDINEAFTDIVPEQKGRGGGNSVPIP